MNRLIMKMKIMKTDNGTEVNIQSELIYALRELKKLKKKNVLLKEQLNGIKYIHLEAIDEEEMASLRR